MVPSGCGVKGFDRDWFRRGFWKPMYLQIMSLHPVSWLLLSYIDCSTREGAKYCGYTV